MQRFINTDGKNMTEPKKILLAHGGGGQLSESLIRDTILARIGTGADEKLNDAALLELTTNEVCFTTDSYVVKPLFFNGGDIGKLAVCGTVNDLAVSGAKPVALSLAFIIEAGLEFEVFEKILDSIKAQCDESDVKIVTGDTKTVDSGAADKIFINTAGIGTKLAKADLGFDKIVPGDNIIISGTIGDHGMTVMSQREGIEFQTSLKSDCASLASITGKLIDELGAKVRYMRDPTRGGLAASLSEISQQSGNSIETIQDSIPIDPTVQAAADILGFDLLNIANEGKLVAVVSQESSQKALDIIQSFDIGKKAAIIGKVTESKAGKPIVEMITTIGGKRIVQMPYGRELPRIC